MNLCSDEEPQKHLQEEQQQQQQLAEPLYEQFCAEQQQRQEEGVSDPVCEVDLCSSPEPLFQRLKLVRYMQGLGVFVVCCAGRSGQWGRGASQLAFMPKTHCPSHHAGVLIQHSRHPRHQGYRHLPRQSRNNIMFGHVCGSGYC